MFTFIHKDNEYLVRYPNNESRVLSNSEIEKFYERINAVIDLLGLQSIYEQEKLQKNIRLLDFAFQHDIDLDACLYAVLSQFELEKPLV